MTIAVNDAFPSVTTKCLGANGIEDFTLADEIKGKTVVIFGLPGAYTPSCSQKHLPGYINNAQALKDKGVEQIYCLSVNDPFVMKAWGDALGVQGKVEMVADGLGALTKALGLEFDGSGAGLGTRSKRFSMVVKDGIIKSVEVEESAGNVDLSSAEKCLLNV